MNSFKGGLPRGPNIHGGIVVQQFLDNIARKASWNRTCTWKAGWISWPNLVCFQFSMIRIPPYIFPTLRLPRPISKSYVIINNKVRMAERSKALRSGRSPLRWAGVRISLLTATFAGKRRKKNCIWKFLFNCNKKNRKNVLLMIRS